MFCVTEPVKRVGCDERRFTTREKKGYHTTACGRLRARGAGLSPECLRCAVPSELTQAADWELDHSTFKFTNAGSAGGGCIFRPRSAWVTNVPIIKLRCVLESAGTTVHGAQEIGRAHV